MLVTLVIPTYNRQYLLTETLTSISTQTYQNWECLIVDDSSTDRTPEVIAEWEMKDPRFKGVRNRRRKGAQGARNTGLMLARGEFILFVDSDDVLHHRKIELQVKEFEMNPQLDMNYAFDVFFIQEPGDYDRLWNIPSETNMISRFLHDDVPFHTQSPLWRLSFIRKNEMSWDENLTCWQDWDFNLRAIIRGLHYKALPQVLGYIRNHDSNRISNSTFNKAYKSMLHCGKNVYCELAVNESLKNEYRNAFNIFLLLVLKSIFRNKKRTLKVIVAYYDLLFLMMKSNGKLSFRMTLKSFYYLLFDFQQLHGWTLSYAKEKYAIRREIESMWATGSINEAHNVNFPSGQ